MSFVFPAALDAMLSGKLSASGQIAAHLVSRAPNVRLDAVDELTGRAVVATEQVSASVNGGAVACADLRFPNVSGDQCVGVLFMVDGMPLVFLDEGFPVQPIGTDVIVSIKDGVLFRIS